jgi:hypothetical protein
VNQSLLTPSSLPASNLPKLDGVSSVIGRNTGENSACADSGEYSSY